MLFCDVRHKLLVESIVFFQEMRKVLARKSENRVEPLKVCVFVEEGSTELDFSRNLTLSTQQRDVEISFDGFFFRWHFS